MNREGYHRPRHNWFPSARQQEILDALISGVTNAEIAQGLGISPDGVRWQINQLLYLTGLNDRQALAVWWEGTKDRGRRSNSALVSLFRFGVATVTMILLVVAFLRIEQRYFGTPDPHPSSDDSSQLGPIADSVQLEDCSQTAPEGFEVVSGPELRNRGLLPVARLIAESPCPIHVMAQLDRVYVWLPSAATLKQDPPLISWPRTRTVATWFNLPLVASVAGKAIPLNIRPLNTRLIDEGKRGFSVPFSSGGALLAILNPIDTPSHRVGIDSEGTLFLSAEQNPSNSVIDAGTGTSLDSSGLTGLSTASVPGSSIEYTTCEVDICSVVHLGGSILAPVAGRLVCPTQGGTLDQFSFELDAGDIVLRFNALDPAGIGTPSLSTVACYARDVYVGEQIRHHDHYRITAVSEDGTALSTVVNEAGRLFVGSLAVRLRGPWCCLQ